MRCTESIYSASVVFPIVHMGNLMPTMYEITHQVHFKYHSDLHRNNNIFFVCCRFDTPLSRRSPMALDKLIFSHATLEYISPGDTCSRIFRPRLRALHTFAANDLLLGSFSRRYILGWQASPYCLHLSVQFHSLLWMFLTNDIDFLSSSLLFINTSFRT